MNIRTQRLCAATGPAFVLLWLMAFWPIAGFVPPPSPSSSIEAVTSTFADHRNAVRLGLMITTFASVLMIPWCVAITVQMQRVEGRYSPLAYTQLISGTLLVLVFLFPVMWWQVAAYRPERSPELIRLLHDLGWMTFVGIVTTVVLQCASIGILILMDKRRNPLFPRWFGYFSIWAAVIFTPGALCVFFQNGPFAWNGIFAWWLPLSAFATWIIVMYVMLRRAIDNQAEEEAEPASASTGTASQIDIQILIAEVEAFRGDLSELKARLNQ